MTKKEKMYLLIFVFSLISLIVAVILKCCGVTWFSTEFSLADKYETFDYIGNIVYLIAQGFLVLGCCTWIKPKMLIKAYIPFMPLNLLLFFISSNTYQIGCLIIMFSMAMSINHKLYSILRFIAGLIFVCGVQWVSNFVKYEIIGIQKLSMSFTSLILGSIDQFIIYSAFYYFVIKCGEKLWAGFVGSSSEK